MLGGVVIKIFMLPQNNYRLFNLIKECGHKPLIFSGINMLDGTSSLHCIHLDEKERDGLPELHHSNVTKEEMITGLRYVGVEAPSGVRGRVGRWGPIADMADAAIIIHNSPIQYGCVWCQSTFIFLAYLLKRREIPIFETVFPGERGIKKMYAEVSVFLGRLS